MSNHLPTTQPDLFEGTVWAQAWKVLHVEILTSPEWAGYRRCYGIPAADLSCDPAVNEACEEAGLYGP